MSNTRGAAKRKGFLVLFFKKELLSSFTAYRQGS